jgi:hypothetical protein
MMACNRIVTCYYLDEDCSIELSYEVKYYNEHDEVVGTESLEFINDMSLRDWLSIQDKKYNYAKPITRW